jgi:meso-butanediol dehydrogenase / (S,S)-butanediol dehydrogenase / diacetyl reductase
MRFQNKVAIVTGAGQGIGEAAAVALAAEGAKVIIAERVPETCHRTAEKTGGIPYVIDVSDTDAVRRMVAEVVRDTGHIDILINNAGVNGRYDLLDITPEHWRELMATNMDAVFFTTQIVAAQMIAQIHAQIPDFAPNQTTLQRSYGKIVNLSSVAGRKGRPHATAYATSKMAVIGVTQASAQRLAPYGINVNAVCPGIVATPMWDEIDRIETERRSLPRGEWLRRRTEEKVPLRRPASSEEIARVIAFLCSADADYITGQSLNIDGGYEMN